MFRGDLILDGAKIRAAGPHLTEKADHDVDARKFLIAPGLINAHTHVANTLLRSVADDMDFGKFLETMFAFDARRTEQDLEAGALLGGAEMLLSGTTTFLDMYYGEDSVARACERLGMRGFLGWAVLDPEITTQKGVPVENARDFISRWKGNALVTPLVAPQGVYAGKAETWLAARDLAAREKTPVHYHLSETRFEVDQNQEKRGKRPPEWLDEIGFLGPNQVAAHGVWLTTAEIALLAKKGVAVTHCPSSNMKLACGGGGVAPVTELRAAGAVVALGTDSSTSNNGLSMLREMHLAGLVHKHQRHDATSLPAQVVLDMATVEGARALGQSGRLGALVPDHQADLVLYDLTHPSMLPTRAENAVSNLVYSASDEAVHTVYVAGRPVVEARRLTGISGDALMSEVETTTASLFTKTA